MNISRERLLEEASLTGFRPEILEKVIQLLNLLEVFQSHPFLKDRMALKGGTALNLFLFDLPRLSVDIDLNYIAASDRETMISDRSKIAKALDAVCSREALRITRAPDDHAGGKFRLQYTSALGGNGNLEVDFNFMFRIPLWPIQRMDSVQLGSYSVKQIPLLDLHELAAGKLAALLARHASRDLFDAHQLLTQTKLDRNRLRLGFVLYGAMNRKDWRKIQVTDVEYDSSELEHQLVPVLRNDKQNPMITECWAKRIIKECREGLQTVLPFTEQEHQFLDRILDYGEIRGELLTDDVAMQQCIENHPLLQWKAMNVRKHKKGN